MFRVDPNTVRIHERHRALNEEAVLRLQTSISEIGLKHPITVRIEGDEAVLVSGAHRLEAVKRLGWQSIECAEIDNDEIKAEMWEIAENLHRLDLTKEQRDEHIRRYAELLKSTGIPEPQNAAVEIGYGKPPPAKKGIARKISEATGLSDDTIRRALAPKPQKRRPQPSTAGKQLAKLRQAWREAGPVVRQHFLSEITERSAA